jgi:hypothetical protein
MHLGASADAAVDVFRPRGQRIVPDNLMRRAENKGRPETHEVGLDGKGDRKKYLKDRNY